MEAIQATILIFVAIAGAAVVFTREPTSQVIMLSFYSFLLSIMFVAFQAPTVALSEVSVSWVILPLLILLAITRVNRASQ